MKTKAPTKKRAKRDLLVGTWFSANEYASEVEFVIERTGETYTVQARDGYDSEQADIFETAWDGSVLSFAAHWNSTGRFARYRILVISANRISLTYTYTDNEMYHRKPKARNA